MPILTGTSGPDTLSGGPGDDQIDGGAGDDSLNGDGGGISGVGGFDTLHGSDGADSIQDSFAAGAQLFGDAGADNIILGINSSAPPGGHYTVDGGAGSDSILVQSSTFPASGPGASVVVVGGTDGAGDLIRAFDLAHLTITAGSGVDQIEVGSVGEGVITLGGGGDLLRVDGYIFAPGMVVVTDFSAGDPATGDQLSLNLFEQSSPSHPFFSANTLRVAQVGADAVFQLDPEGQGGDWTNFLVLKNVDAHDLTPAVMGESTFGVWQLGGTPADTMTTSAAFPNVDGGAGSDSLVGDAANNRLTGEAGDDTMMAGSGNDTLSDFSGQNYLRGEDGDDVITGGGDFDDINGNKGNDTIDGGAGGGDWLVGGQGDDVITSHHSADILYGNLGNDTLHGGDGVEVMRGGQGDDVIFGGSGVDFISGDRGNDTEIGGAGADIFHGSQDAGIDRVLDFRLSDGDRVQLDPGTTYKLSQVGADTVIDMGGGNQMILVGVQLSSLTGNWIFEG